MARRKRRMKRIVQAGEIEKRVEEACLKANIELRLDAVFLIERALDVENPPAAKKALQELAENYRLAAEKRMPLCQDCGYAGVFVEMGQDVQLENGLISEAIQSGIIAAYRRHNLRQSVIADALLARDDFETADLATIYLSLVKGEQLKITVMLKGGGSDNASRLVMLKPTASWEEIVKFVVDTVKATGWGACPPLFLGIGIGGSFDTVALLSKKALLRRFDRPNPHRELADFEARILREVNSLGIGPAGLGGSTTALGVSIITAPSHIACLPVAINMGCNSLRSVEIEL